MNILHGNLKTTTESPRPQKDYTLLSHLTRVLTTSTAISSFLTHEWIVISIFIVQTITVLQIIHNNRRNKNGGYQKSLDYLSWKPVNDKLIQNPTSDTNAEYIEPYFEQIHYDGNFKLLWYDKIQQIWEKRYKLCKYSCFWHPITLVRASNVPQKSYIWICNYSYMIN